MIPSDISLNFNSSGASVITNPRRRFISIKQWTDVFTKYASVVRFKYPDSAVALANYSVTVQSIANLMVNSIIITQIFENLDKQLICLRI